MPSTVVLGTGIIGLSTAYYLSQLAENDPDTTPTAANPHQHQQQSQRPREKHEIHLVEPSPELFASASGKAAGFLAKDWFAPAVAPLGELSFDLHRQLAQEHNGKERWGWAESVSYSLDREDDYEDTDESALSEDEPADEDEAGAGAAPAEPPQSPRQSRHRALNDLDWLMSGSSRATLLEASEAAAASAHAADVDADAHPRAEKDADYPRWVRADPSTMQAISDRTTTGQVDPYRLCQFLLQECVNRGVKLHHPARATQLVEQPAETGGLTKTFVRLQFLGSDPEAVVASTSTPNSTSPPPDVLKASPSSEPSSVAPDGSARASDERAADATRGHGRNGLSRSSSPPIDSEGSPTGVDDDVPADDERPQGQSHSDMDDVLETLDVPCDSLVITAGCWTPRVYRTLFPNAGRIPRITALAGHSAVFKSRKWMRTKTKRPRPQAVDSAGEESLARRPVHQLRKGDSDHSLDSVSTSSSAALGRASPAPSFSRTSSTISTPPTSPGSSHVTLPSRPQAPLPDVCHAIFTSDRKGYSPEIFSRVTGDVWLGGLNSATIPLPALPTMAKTDPDAIRTLLNTAEALLGPIALHDSAPGATPSAKEPPAQAPPPRPTLTLLRTGLCFRPVTPTGRPVIARMHEADLGDGVRVPGGVFVATGHGPWGISLSLGTGRVVSEMVLGRPTSVDVGVLGKWEAGPP